MKAESNRVESMPPADDARSDAGAAVPKILRWGYRRQVGSTALGQYIVSSRAIHRGAPTFRGTCIRVTDILHQLYQSVPHEEILERAGGRLTPQMLQDALELERQILEEERRREIAETKLRLRSRLALA